MARYRKKPVEIEAVCWTGKMFWPWMEDWIYAAVLGGKVVIDFEREELSVETLEGKMKASKGDWIIRGVKGELYPCKPDVFAMTYEEA